MPADDRPAHPPFDEADALSVLDAVVDVADGGGPPGALAADAWEAAFAACMSPGAVPRAEAGFRAFADAAPGAAPAIERLRGRRPAAAPHPAV